MNFELSEELKMLRDTVRSFAEEKIAPFAEEWDRRSYFPYREAVKPMGE
ncbi:MAG: acyl-CoA dehydrogenase family protein, partial [Syntrophobacterales bacterium]|nr:acyl-CoA dehydrogenase family protein [Syntrophobacterales bacterium]